MDELHRYRSLADARSDALHGTMPHIAHRKDSGDICLEQEWIPVQRPPLGALSVTDKARGGQEEASLISFDQNSQPTSTQQGSHKHEDRIRLHPFNLAGIEKKNQNLFQALFPIPLVVTWQFSHM